VRDTFEPDQPDQGGFRAQISEEGVSFNICRCERGVSLRSDASVVAGIRGVLTRDLARHLSFCGSVCMREKDQDESLHCCYPRIQTMIDEGKERLSLQQGNICFTTLLNVRGLARFGCRRDGKQRRKTIKGRSRLCCLSIHRHASKSTSRKLEWGASFYCSTIFKLPESFFPGPLSVSHPFAPNHFLPYHIAGCVLPILFLPYLCLSCTLTRRRCCTTELESYQKVSTSYTCFWS